MTKTAESSYKLKPNDPDYTGHVLLATVAAFAVYLTARGAAKLIVALGQE